MNVRLYVDHHVPSAVTEGLRQSGVDVLTAQEDGHSDAEDPVVLERATTLGRAVYTQDRDFLAVAHEWLHAGREFAGVIFAHQLNITLGQAINDLKLVTTVLESDEMYNRIEFLPIR